MKENNRKYTPTIGKRTENASTYRKIKKFGKSRNLDDPLDHLLDDPWITIPWDEWVSDWETAIRDQISRFVDPMIDFRTV